MDDFWDRYKKDLEDGYFKFVNGKKCLKSEFIVEYPKKISKQLEHSKKNKLSQLWKFYDHARRILDSLQQNNDPIEVLKAQLYELQPAVFYAEGRNTVSDKFVNFIDLNTTHIKDNDDLGAFIQHFQSVIAYLPRQNQR